jgi:hypothetical protein
MGHPQLVPQTPQPTAHRITLTVPQVLLGARVAGDKLQRGVGRRDPVTRMLLKWTRTGVAFKLVVLGSMLAGPVAAAVASGTALLVGYGYIMPKDVTNLMLGASVDVIVPGVVQILLQQMLMRLQGVTLDTLMEPSVVPLEGFDLPSKTSLGVTTSHVSLDPLDEADQDEAEAFEI